jgi:aminodeoxyfutalosine deaminase
VNETVFLSRWLAPMSPSLPARIEGAAVRVRDGRIVVAGRSDDVSRLDARVVDLGDTVVLPGLINAHTHLELSDARPGLRPASFGEWILGVVRHQRAVERTDEAIASATLAGANESLGFGVTTVGDISRSCAVSRHALRRSRLHVVSFGEVQAMAQRRSMLETGLATAIDRADQTDRLRVAVSPHAPYTVEPSAYRRCIETAVARGLRLSTHVAESVDERTFLESHAGPLREVWDTLGTWDEHVPRWPAGPIDLAARVGLLDMPALLAHVNIVSDDELRVLSRGRASVVYCPRTHAFFGHPPHRWRDMLARGINVCVGTDSRASAPDLNVVDDIRWLHRLAPDVAPSDLWALITTRAAAALCLDDVGRLVPGARDHLVVFATQTGDPLREILQTDRRPVGGWLDGTPVEGPATSF